MFDLCWLNIAESSESYPASPVNLPPAPDIWSVSPLNPLSCRRIASHNRPFQQREQMGAKHGKAVSISLDISPSPFRSDRKRRVKRGEESSYRVIRNVNNTVDKLEHIGTNSWCSMVFIHVRTFSADVPTLESCSALVSPRVCSALPKALQVDTRYIYGESTDCERGLIRRSPDMLVCWVRTVCLVSWKAMGVWHATYFHISCIHCIRSAHHLDPFGLHLGHWGHWGHLGSLAPWIRPAVTRPGD